MKAPERLFVEVCEDGIFAFPEPPFEESVEYIRADLVPICPKQNDTESWNEDHNEEDLQTRFAFYTYKDDPSVLYLSNVFVEEASRNHGLGTRILSAAEKVAETVGATTICLKVKQDSPANAWYRKNGYGYMTFEGEYDWLEKTLEYMKPVKQEQNEEVMKLEEGIYDIPDNCTAVYANRQVIIKQKRPKPTILTCRNCKHQQYGRKSMQNQWWDSFYCDISPKIIAGKTGYYYNANPSKKACEKFEQKED